MRLKKDLNRDLNFYWRLMEFKYEFLIKINLNEILSKNVDFLFLPIPDIQVL